MTSKNECYVYIVLPGTTEFVTAARFRISKTREGEPVGELIYGKQYLACPDAVALDPVELQLMETQFRTTRMHGFFGAIRDAMPDYWGRCVIERNLYPIIPDEFLYLLQGPDDRAGALGFGLNVVPPAPQKKFNRTLNLAVLQETAEALIKGTPQKLSSDQQQVQALLLQGTSMGGARPKAVIEDSAHLWVAKFSSPTDRWNQPCVEHAMLVLAKKCGIQVAESKLTRVAGKDVLLVKRFDRAYANSGYFRYRMVSALTLLQSEDIPLSPHANWSYLQLADEIRRISDHPKKDLQELFKRMCFNALISNLDDHPRNHAILAKAHTWRLSPAYDLTPTLTRSEERLLAMQCGIYGRFATRKNLLSGCAAFMLSEEEALYIIDKMVHAVKKEWRPALRRVSLTEVEAEYLMPAFAHEGFFYE